MKKLNVHYCGWGEDWLLGQLAEDGDALLFEYSPIALAQGLELSPLHLKLRSPAYGDFPACLHYLPGFIADSLPDGWGLLLMDRCFRQMGVRAPSPLDRLSFIGNRTLGALRFATERKMAEEEPHWDLLALAAENARAMAEAETGEAAMVLRQLALVGGSPQGTRPKALVNYDLATQAVSTRSDAKGQPWLVKFPAQGEDKEVAAVEALYAELARACDLAMPETAYFDLSPTLAAFAVARFDRENSMRVPIHSLAGLLHIDFRLPGSCDYTAFLRATRFLTRDEREVQKAYARAVFNVLFHNQDDHPKNVAWRLGQDRRWYLAPAFDLTFCTGARGEHHMDVCGKGREITRSALLQLAKEGGVPLVNAKRMIEKMRVQADAFAQYASLFPIRHKTVQEIEAAVNASCKRLASSSL